MTPFSIGITTRNRPGSLRACLDSIARVLGGPQDVLVFDDGSDVPVAEQLAHDDPCLRPRILRDESSAGPIHGRNVLMRESRHDLVLLLDDDALLLESESLDRAAALLGTDPAVAAVGFAQADASGRPWPERMQPGIGAGPMIVPAYIGFAVMLRRASFFQVGGYRSELVFYGEEKELCLRLLAAGYSVVYLPDALVAHVQDPAGRDRRRHLRYLVRNDILMSVYNHPLPVVIAWLPLRWWRYRRLAAHIPGGDPGGPSWLARELGRALPGVPRLRRPVGWRTLREWRRRQRYPRYESPAASDQVVTANGVPARGRTMAGR